MKQGGVRTILSRVVYGRGHGQPDTLFVVALFALVTFGLLMLSSASAVVSYQKYGSAYYYITHQILFGFLPGLFLFALCSRFPYQYLQKYAFFFLLASIILLVLVFIPGVGYEYGGARRWLHAGPYLFQPSEFVKLTFLLYLATWLSKKGEKHVQNFSYGFLPFLALLGTIALLVIAQPDMGTMGIIVLIAFTMFAVGGAKFSHVTLAVFGGLIVAMVLVNTASYRFERFTTFLHPQQDPQGLGYHINQALLAVGSGGALGRGFGHSRQKFAYLPEVTGDSIFAIIAEELGFVLSIVLISLIMFLVFRGLAIARRTPDVFGRLVVVGVMSWIAFQSFINIGAMLSVLPLTGIPLPFISYGGSSLIILMAAAGIVANISRS
ncbi:MAG: putative lipid II flippase FtsW [Patescibacteria group bacterium]